MTALNRRHAAAFHMLGTHLQVLSESLTFRAYLDQYPHCHISPVASSDGRILFTLINGKSMNHAGSYYQFKSAHDLIEHCHKDLTGLLEFANGDGWHDERTVPL